MPATVKEYVLKHPHWEKEIQKLRELMLSAGLEETIKWGAPAYTLNEKNVVGIAAFKNHVALWFFQGALLKENTSLLYNAQEEKTAGMRQIRFKKGEPIKTEVLERYVLEAVQNQREGRMVERTKPKKPENPAELQEALDKDYDLNTAFQSLSLGKQREYTQYISGAKRPSTKTSRLQKIIPMISEGRGLNDKYRK